MNECPFCNAQVESVLRHVPDCELAPVPAKVRARAAIKGWADHAKMPSPCCKLRKKILLAPSTLSEQDCGVSDAELADVMTFDKFAGLDVITFKFCPWCGKPWQQMGYKVT